MSSATPSSAGGKKRGRRKKAKCALCEERFYRITPAHLRTHGYTYNRYLRVFGDLRLSPPHHDEGKTAHRDDPELHPDDHADPHESIDLEDLHDESKRELVIENVAQRLAKKKAWLNCIADEVGEKMVTGVLRHRLTAALVTTLAGRLQVQGEAQALLADVLQELREEWRIKQGGPGGGPTPTGDLVSIAQALTKQLKDSEDLVLRAVKLALDEQRLNAEHTDSLGPALYTGDAETIDATIDGGEREAIRTLLGRLAVAAKKVEPKEIRDSSKDDHRRPSADTRAMAPETGAAFDEDSDALKHSADPAKSGQGNSSQKSELPGSTEVKHGLDESEPASQVPAQVSSTSSSRKRRRRRRQRAAGDVIEMKPSTAEGPRDAKAGTPPPTPDISGEITESESHSSPNISREIGNSE